MTKVTDFDRSELVRLDRMRRCHEEDRPAPREIERALSRLDATRQRRRGQRVTRVLAVAAAVSLSTLGAFATTEKLGLTAFTALWRSKRAPAGVPPAPSTRSPVLSRAGGPISPPAAARDLPGTASAS